MKFDLRRPCPNCPFRTDCMKGWLGRERARQIATALVVEQQTFSCHETTHHDDDGEHEPQDTEQHCAGALLVIENSGAAPPQLVRVAERTAQPLAELDADAPVFGSFDAFVEHHSDEAVDEPEGEPCSVANPGCEAPAGVAGAFGGAVSLDVPEGATVECWSCGEPVCENCSITTERTKGELVRLCAHCEPDDDEEDE